MMRAAALSVVLFLSVGLVACGNEGGGGGGGGGGSGGGGTGGGGIVGAWTIDLAPLMDAALVQAQSVMQSKIDEAPAEQREMMKNLMPSKEKLLEQIKAQYSSLKALVQFNADHSFTHSSEMGSQKETSEGTWAQSGDQITVTPRTFNGKPVEGEHAKPKTLTFKDGKLTGQPEPGAPTFTFRRL